MNVEAAETVRNHFLFSLQHICQCPSADQKNHVFHSFQVSVKAEEMRSQADVFRKTARETKLHFCWQHYKMILLLLVILITIGVVIWLIITGGKTKGE